MRPWLPKCAAAGALSLMTLLSHAADVLIGSVYDTHYQGSGDDLGGAIAWQHVGQPGGLLIGISNTGYPIGTLTEGDVDADYIVSPRLTVSGGASLGEASTPGRSNTLYKMRASVDATIDSRWSLHEGYQYFDLYLIHGDLLTSSVECHLPHSLGIRVGGGYDVNGTVANRYGDAEIDWYGKERLYAGVVYGRTGYDPAELGAAPFERRLFQVYAGAAIPVSAATLTIGVDSLSLEGVGRQTVRIGLNQPIPP
jgi:hypothetical protein